MNVVANESHSRQSLFWTRRSIADNIQLCKAGEGAFAKHSKGGKVMADTSQ